MDRCDPPAVVVWTNARLGPSGSLVIDYSAHCDCGWPEATVAPHPSVAAAEADAKEHAAATGHRHQRPAA